MQELIDAEVRKLESSGGGGRSGAAGASRSGRNRSAAQLEAAMASGLGSIGLFAGEVAKHSGGSGSGRTAGGAASALARAAGPAEIDRLAAALADQGFDLDGDWGALQ
eukprot:328507-Chlamydomonas_euryale.AAC.1